jgi:hypothetical protein
MERSLTKIQEKLVGYRENEEELKFQFFEEKSEL